ncbi:MAG: GMC family oxidoreductase [Cytophagales bacterium]|nr:GMC family oxidoreductase [Cytophagales bacterium]
MKEVYDYIIVGAGTAGGVLSYNLTRAGANCLLIEAGKHFTKETFPATEADASAQMYWGGGMELSYNARMAFLRGRLVGGGSVVNQALMDRFDDIALHDWRDESGIEFFNKGEMAPLYEQAERMISLHTFRAEERTRNAELFARGCDACGYEWHFLRRAQKDCAFSKYNDCIACLGGCHRDSKQSTLITYIRDAEKEGLNILADTSIEKIEDSASGVLLYGIRKGERVALKAKKAILSGGAFGTTTLLLKSGFKKQLPSLGRYFATHPQFMFFGLYDEIINAHKGMFQSVASKDSGFRAKGFKLENVFAGPASVAMLFPGYGADHLEFMRHYNRMTCAEVAVRDENAGEILVDKKGNMVVKKDMTEQDHSRMQQGVEVLKEILAASGAKRVIESPLYFGLHLMGGARIGVDPVAAVVDPDFKLKTQRNIYVCDSSLFPNAPGINPALTIMALAHKLSRQLIA